MSTFAVVAALAFGFGQAKAAHPPGFFVTLNDGKQMPALSLGTCCGSDPKVGLMPWIKAGGVGIDTAIGCAPRNAACYGFLRRVPSSCTIRLRPCQPWPAACSMAADLAWFVLRRLASVSIDTAIGCACTTPHATASCVVSLHRAPSASARASRGQQRAPWPLLWLGLFCVD
jgi:hypothetical protein